MMNEHSVFPRKIYAAKRAAVAFKRFTEAHFSSEKERARSWTRLWGIVAGYWLSPRSAKCKAVGKPPHFKK